MHRDTHGTTKMVGVVPAAWCWMLDDAHAARRDNAATEHVQNFRERGDDVAIKDSCSWRQAAARLGTRTTDRQIWCEKHDINWTTACQFQQREPWAGWLAVVSGVCSGVHVSC